MTTLLVVLLATAEVEAQPAAAPPAEESAAALQLEIGLRPGGSSWRGDFASYGELKLGGKLWDVLGLYTLLRLGYGTVDQRLLTYLSIGVQGWIFPSRDFSPYARLAALHQHEESFASVDEEPLGAIFGVGTGIRHRYGGELALGVDQDLGQWQSLLWHISYEANTALQGASSGPVFYAGVSVRLGFDFPL